MRRDSFRQALSRANLDAAGLDAVQCAGARYRLLETLGGGEISQVYLAQRVSSFPLLVTIKLSSAPVAPGRYAREASVLHELQRLDSDGAGAYFSRLFPEAIAHGVVEGPGAKRGLVLRYPSGFWGSLAALHERFAAGIDPRHGIWIWRRMLELLSFTHRHGWSHGDIRPEHALVHPQDHAVQLIDWASAKRDAGAKDKATDLSRSARVVQVLLCGTGGSGAFPDSVPPGLAQFVTRAAMDEDFCGAQGAEGLDALLRAEAITAFGPPTFVPLRV